MTTTPHIFEIVPSRDAIAPVPVPQDLDALVDLIVGPVIPSRAADLEAAYGGLEDPSSVPGIPVTHAWSDAAWLNGVWRQWYTGDPYPDDRTSMPLVNPRTGHKAMGRLVDWIGQPVLPLGEYVDPFGLWMGAPYQGDPASAPGTRDNVNNAVVEALRVGLVIVSEAAGDAPKRRLAALQERRRAIAPIALQTYTTTVVDPVNAAIAAINERTTP